MSMKRSFLIVVVAVGLVPPTSCGLMAQGLGTVAGTVVSSEDSSALIGANVLIQGTVLGATSGIEGRLIISRVPEGMYDLLISRVGYERRLLSGVVVTANDTS